MVTESVRGIVYWPCPPCRHHLPRALLAATGSQRLPDLALRVLSSPQTLRYSAHSDPYDSLRQAGRFFNEQVRLPCSRRGPPSAG